MGLTILVTCDLFNGVTGLNLSCFLDVFFKHFFGFVPEGVFAGYLFYHGNRHFPFMECNKSIDASESDFKESWVTAEFGVLVAEIDFKSFAALVFNGFFFDYALRNSIGFNRFMVDVANQFKQFFMAKAVDESGFLA